MDAFLNTVAARMREAVQSAAGANPVEVARLRSQVTARMAEEQRALAAALATEAFMHSTAAAYVAELAKHGQTVSLSEGKRETDSILRNRIEDLQNFQKLLLQADFLAAAHTRAQQPAPAPKPYALSAAKIAEEVDSLVLPYRPTGPQPAVHVAMAARGHQVGHAALAEIFKPTSGPLRAPLVHALAGVWPAASGEVIEVTAANWLKARHDPAHSITDALAPDGIIYTTAMTKAETLQQQKLAQNIPATAITQPRVAQGTVQPFADLVTAV